MIAISEARTRLSILNNNSVTPPGQPTNALRSSAPDALEAEASFEFSSPSDGDAETLTAADLLHFRRPLSPRPTTDVGVAGGIRPTSTAPEDPSLREDYILDQLPEHEDLDQLAANVPDDPESFQALLNILHEDFGAVVIDVGDEKRSDNFNTRDLLNLANQLNNLPDHLIEAYLAEGQTIRLSNGSQVGDDPDFLPLAQGANINGTDQNPGGVAHHQGPDGSGVAFVTLAGLREDGQGGPNPFGVDGSESTILHELAHGLDDIGGDDNNFNDFSSSEEWRSILDDPQVLSFWQDITADGSAHETTARYEESFAELFARYYASGESRATLPAPVQQYFAQLVLQPT